MQKQTALSLLKENALEDYQEAALKAEHYNSFISRAIREYTPKPSNQKWSRVLFRLIVVPFWGVPILFFALRMWIKHCILYVKFGGMGIVYADKDESKTIHDLYNAVKDSELFELKK